MFGTILVIAFAGKCDDTRRVFPADIPAQVFRALQAQPGEALIIVCPPFLAGAEPFFGEIASSGSAERRELGVRCRRWLEESVAPALRSVGTEPRLGPVLTLSCAAFEAYVLRLVDAYVGALADRLQAEMPLRSSAQVNALTGDAFWRPIPIRRTRQGRFLRVLPGPVLCCGADPLPSMPARALLAADDMAVVSLAAAAHPDAKLVCLCEGEQLPPGLRDLDVERHAWR